MAWTEEEDATLRALYLRGISCREIGRRLDKSSSCIHDRCKKLGFTFSVEQTEKATALRVAVARAKQAELLDWLTDRAIVNARRLDTHPFLTCTRTQTGAITNELEYVPADDEFALTRAISVAVSTIERLVKMGSDITPEDTSLVAKLRDKLSDIREARKNPETPPVACENTDT